VWPDWISLMLRRNVLPPSSVVTIKPIKQPAVSKRSALYFNIILFITYPISYVLLNPIPSIYVCSSLLSVFLLPDELLLRKE
jgi:hypothetical protein